MYEITIKKRNRKRKRRYIKSKLEDLFFNMLLKLPDWMIPKWLNRKVEKYLEKKTRELKRKLVKLNYNNAMLKKAIEDLNLVEGH